MSSFSRSFNYHDKVNWVAKLKEVHGKAWGDWQKHLSTKPLYKLKDRDVQKPGEISADVLEELTESITSLPPKHKYGRS